MKCNTKVVRFTSIYAGGFNQRFFSRGEWRRNFNFFSQLSSGTIRKIIAGRKLAWRTPLKSLVRKLYDETHANTEQSPKHESPR